MRYATFLLLVLGGSVFADGKVFGPRSYQGSLEEQSQEAILISTPGAVQELILKIAVKGDIDRFAWVVPFPTEPKVGKEDAVLFVELFNYVESRLVDRRRAAAAGSRGKSEKEGKSVDVLRRMPVGSYDVALVRENEAGALNRWLVAEGYHGLGDHSEDVLRFYREKKFVFACIKVRDATAEEKQYLELHPLRFTFRTGRDEGIYFPMKLTGLQKDPFDITLYVFHRYWIDNISPRSYEHQGFRLEYRDWDSTDCVANGGKLYANPREDPFLKSKAALLPATARLFQQLHPEDRED